MTPIHWIAQREYPQLTRMPQILFSQDQSFYLRHHAATAITLRQDDDDLVRASARSACRPTFDADIVRAGRTTGGKRRGRALVDDQQILESRSTADDEGVAFGRWP